ncbi:hypothetical protein SLS55_000950 [Diplodia seriata]|uniref:Uncharacterized protein n=1 Tax=Diplodia seriata TaxID=420778 RepID=A0ABR3CWV3_9PEZI
MSSDSSMQRKTDTMDERSPLLPPPRPGVDDDEAALPSPTSQQEKTTSKKKIISVLAVLLIGVLLSNADVSIVLATHALIASEFDDLSNSSWIFVGKLSDLYGRKSVLLITYALFTIGCCIIYVNIISTTGRSLGGPVGGWFADTIGWRWTFLAQVPPMVVAIALAWLLVPSHTQEDASATDDDDDDDASAPPAKQPSIFSRLDILGSVALTATILLLMFPLELGGQKIPWSHPLIPILLGSAIVTGTLFIHFERRAGSSSVLPLAIFRSRDTSIALVIMALQVAAQGGMMFTVPLYFQITDGLSATRAGAHLFPAVLGNTASGLLSGAAIARTGRYKALVTLGTVCTSACYVLMLLRWDGSGRAGGWESLYVVPGGFGTGMAASALFIAMTASVAPAHVAIASSTMYLAGGVGALVGMASSAAVLQTIVHRGLQGVVGPDFPDRDDFLRRCLEDIGFLQRLRGSVKERIVHVYVQGFRGAYGKLMVLMSMRLV